MLDDRPAGEEVGDEELERWRIESGIPRWGSEIDERILPAEAGLDETHISFSKGCYPGQEPIARQRYRGKVNRKLRVLEIEGDAEPGDELLLDGKAVGRITSAVQGSSSGLRKSRSPRRRNTQHRREAGLCPASLTIARGSKRERLEIIMPRVARRISRRSAPGKIRTCDLCLRRAALYPLSYGRPEAAPV